MCVRQTSSNGDIPPYRVGSVSLAISNRRVRRAFPERLAVAEQRGTMPIERLHRFARPAPLAIGMLCAALCLPSVVIARDANPVAVEVADAYLELHTGPGRGYPVTVSR